MDWLVTGTRGGKPGRWKLEAADESAARQKAVAGGVAVQEVRRYPVAQVAAAVPSTEPPEPESPDDEPPVDPGHSAPADREPSAPDEFPSEVGAKEESAGLTPAPEEADEVPAAKSPKSARSNSSGQPPKRKSIWGIAAIAAGVLGAVAGFISPARVAALPLCIAGLLLAIVGIYFSLKRKRSGLLLPAIGAVVCVAATGLAVYSLLHQDHQGQTAAVPTAQELADRARAARIAQSNIQVQFVSIRPAPTTAAHASGEKPYDITFAYRCVASGTSVPQLAGQLRILDASGQEIETLTVFESFPLGLGTTPVQREDRWSLNQATAQRLQGDASQLKVEFDPG